MEAWVAWFEVFAAALSNPNAHLFATHLNSRGSGVTAFTCQHRLGAELLESHRSWRCVPHTLGFILWPWFWCVHCGYERQLLTTGDALRECVCVIWGSCCSREPQSSFKGVLVHSAVGRSGASSLQHKKGLAYRTVPYRTSARTSALSLSPAHLAVLLSIEQLSRRDS